MVNKRKLLGRMVEAGFTQRKLATKLGLSKNTLSSRMSGRSAFNTEEIEAICQILSIREATEKVEIFLPQSSQNKDERINNAASER